jgi:hypothetical protein
MSGGDLRQAVAVARLVLASYVFSGWALGEAIIVMAVVAFSSAGTDPASPHPAAAYFFGLHGVDFLGATALGAVIMVRRSLGVRALVVLSRLGSRTTYLAGLVMASAALRLPLLVLLVALGVGTGRLLPGDLVALPLVVPGLLANAVLVASVTIGLMSPFGGREERLVALVYGVLALVPVIDLPSLARQAQGVIQLPLWPLSVDYQAGYQATALPAELIAVPLVLACAAGVCMVIGRRFAGRDLLLA